MLDVQTKSKADILAAMMDQTRATIDDDPINGSFFMAEMNHTGDTKLMWSKDNADEVDAAREHFNSMRKKGYAAFQVEGKKGDKGAQMNEFDPNAERIIFVKPLAGG